MNKDFLIFLFTVSLLSFNLVALAQSSDESRRTLKLSPEVRIIEREQTIPIIPIEIIQHFLRHPILVTEEEMERGGYILTNSKQTIYSSQGDQIYVAQFDDKNIGNQYVIVRPGLAYRDPLEESEEILAHEAVYLGEATLKKPGEPAILKITSAQREIKAGDRILPLEKRLFPDDIYPHSATRLDEDTYIIAVADGQLLHIGKYQIAIINKGLENNIERGHIFQVNKPRRSLQQTTADDEPIILPPQPIGSLLIFQVFRRVSYALVMSAQSPINLLDEVTIP